VNATAQALQESAASTDQPRLTLIIPVFNEQERIAESLYAIKDYLDEQEYTSEIMIMDDGSNDLTTEVVRVIDFYCQDFKAQTSCHILENVKNVGKGYTIAKGLLTAGGEIVVFTDADSSTPISELSKLLDMFDQGYDVVVGSRNMKESVVVARKTHRKILSFAFHGLTRMTNLSPVKDSQCGFKAYRREVAREVAKRQKTYGFCFDLEHLHIAKKLGYRIGEVPVYWRDSQGSTLSLISDSIAMFLDLFRIRWAHRKLKNLNQ